MTLLEIRVKFITLSGRYDLATASPDFETDAGADFFIVGGCRDLDLEVAQDRDLAFYTKTLTIGDYNFNVAHCRAVKSLWYKDSDDEWNELVHKHYDELLTKYPKLDGTTDGTPAVWAREPLLRDPDNYVASSVEDVGVIFMPPSDTAYDMKLFGTFYSLELSGNTDENYWSVEHPNLLVLAALRHMEAFNRNTQGWNDYNAMIQRYTFGLDKDVALSQMAADMQMEG